MNVSLIKAIVKDLPDDEKIVTFWFDKDQANDMAREHDQEPLTEAEWLVIWEKMSKDKQLNMVADQVFDELFYQMLATRKANQCFVCGGASDRIDSVTNKGVCCKCWGDCPDNIKMKGVQNENQ